MSDQETQLAVVVPPPRDAKGRLLPGSGASLNPGGRSKKLRLIEIALDREHRKVANVLDVFKRLRELAMGEVVEVHGKDGELIRCELRADASFMKLYLDRVLGPVRDDDKIDAAVEKRLREMLEHAETEARRREDERKP